MFAFLRHIECYSVINNFISSGQCSVVKCNQVINIHINEQFKKKRLLFHFNVHVMGKKKRNLHNSMIEIKQSVGTRKFVHNII